MLILSRKKNEAIVFSTSQGDIVVEVVRVNGDKVRLGIECDKSISIHRKEVFDEIKRMTDLTETEKQFDALSDDEDGCGPDGNYVDQ
jgi:carbon storage regulator CsrA